MYHLCLWSQLWPRNALLITFIRSLPCCTVLFSVVLCWAFDTVLYCSVLLPLLYLYWYWIVLYCAVLYCYCTLLRCTELYSTALYWIVLYCYCTILRCYSVCLKSEGQYHCRRFIKTPFSLSLLSLTDTTAVTQNRPHTGLRVDLISQWTSLPFSLSICNYLE
jgi:hypothetical protein